MEFFTGMLIGGCLMFFVGWNMRERKQNRDLEKCREHLTERVSKSLQDNLSKTIMASDEDYIQGKIYNTSSNLWIPESKGE